jgi:hypothetical protein
MTEHDEANDRCPDFGDECKRGIVNLRRRLKDTHR